MSKKVIEPLLPLLAFHEPTPVPLISAPVVVTATPTSTIKTKIPVVKVTSSISQIKKELPTYGPGGDQKLILTSGVSELLREHNKYISNLSIWKQYLIWRYTISSESVTAYLINIEPTENSYRWVYHFFGLYNNRQYGLNIIEEPYRQYMIFFRNPKKYHILRTEQKYQIYKDILEKYVRDLSSIINSSPPVKEDIYVYKVSSPYSEILMQEEIEDISLVQKPFNSTTYDPELNFSPFLSSDPCCFYKIKIQKCSHVLSISPIYHAYPFEKEILLPFGSNLILKNSSTAIINTSKIEYSKIQEPPYLIGELFRIDRLEDKAINQRQIRMFECEVETVIIQC